jgi:16S rRNA (cytosine1402-N4)-methyltransferase
VANIHETVLLEEAVLALNILPDGDYVDATFGRGGHSKKILGKLDSGKLLVVDQDLAAIEEAVNLAKCNTNLIVEHGPFENLQQLINKNFKHKVNGILFDLGISSPQIDQAERGFSFNKSGPLDMRMDRTQGTSAAEWIANADWKEMSKVFWRYGEEKNATKIAKEIVIYREEVGAIKTTEQLASIVEKINRRSTKHPATRVFQAIRIFINRELEQIENVLPVAVEMLEKGGRLVVISFHSLEDRIVKRFIKKLLQPVKFDKRMPIDTLEKPIIKTIGKAEKPSLAEINNNPRARSAIMRVIEKL